MPSYDAGPNAMKPNVQTPGPVERIEQLVAYALAQVPRIRAGDWGMLDPANVRTAFGFHLLQGTLRVEWRPTGEPAGLAIVWQDEAATLRQLDQEGKAAFRWQRTDPDGDCLYLGLVLGTEPHVMRRLAAYFRARFPALPEYAHRRGRLRTGHWLDTLKRKG